MGPRFRGTLAASYGLGGSAAAQVTAVTSPGRLTKSTANANLNTQIRRCSAEVFTSGAIASTFRDVKYLTLCRG